MTVDLECHARASLLELSFKPSPGETGSFAEDKTGSFGLGGVLSEQQRSDPAPELVVRAALPVAPLLDYFPRAVLLAPLNLRIARTTSTPLAAAG